MNKFDFYMYNIPVFIVLKNKSKSLIKIIPTIPHIKHKLFQGELLWLKIGLGSKYEVLFSCQRALPT